jgi:hypothetical protein
MCLSQQLFLRHVSGSSYSFSENRLQVAKGKDEYEMNRISRIKPHYSDS